MAYAGQWGAGLQAASGGLDSLTNLIMQQRQYSRQMAMLKNQQDLNEAHENAYQAMAAKNLQDTANKTPGGMPPVPASAPMQGTPPASMPAGGGLPDPIGGLMKMFGGGQTTQPAQGAATPTAPSDSTATGSQPAPAQTPPPAVPGGLSLGNPESELGGIAPKLNSMGFGAPKSTAAAAPAKAKSDLQTLMDQGLSADAAQKVMVAKAGAAAHLSNGIQLQDHSLSNKWQGPQAAKIGLQEALPKEDAAKIEAVQSAIPAHNAVMALKAAYDATDPTQMQGILQNAIAKHPELSKFFQPTDDRAQLVSEFNSARTALASETFKINNPGSTASPGEKEMKEFKQAYGDINTDPRVFNTNANTFAENQIYSKVPQVLSRLDQERDAKGNFAFPQMDATYKNLQSYQKQIHGQVQALPGMQNENPGMGASQQAATPQKLAQTIMSDPEAGPNDKAWAQSILSGKAQ